MKTYSREELENKSLKELKEIAYSLDVVVSQFLDARLKASWITAILNKMPVKVEAPIVEETQLISHEGASTVEESTPSYKKVETETKTCADCPLFQSFDDGSGRGLCCGADRVARAHHVQTQDCLHMIEAAEQPSVHEVSPEENTKVDDEYTLLPAGVSQTMTAYHVKHQGLIVGMIFNLHRLNTWQCGDGQDYKYPAEAREALVRLTEAPLLKISTNEYRTPDGDLQIQQSGQINLREKLWTNNKDEFYYSTWRDAQIGTNPVAIQFGDVIIGEKIFVDGQARVVKDIYQVPCLGISYTKLVCEDGVEVKAPWYCQVQIAEAVECVA